MTIAKAENSFNLYLANNLKNNKPAEKPKSRNIFAEMYEEELKKQSNK